MEIKDYCKLKSELEENIGKDKIKNITNEIAQIIKKNNLDNTPKVMLDVFEYVRLSILISKI